MRVVPSLYMTCFSSMQSKPIMAIGAVCITGCTIFLLYLNLTHDRSQPSTDKWYPAPGVASVEGSEADKKRSRWTR